MGVVATGLGKSFGDFVALDGVDLDVATGGLTALLGPSGGGKSTLLRILGGLEAPDTGRVVIDGVDVTDVPAQRRNVGFVFQHYAAFRHLSVFRNVAFGLEVRRRPKAEVRRRVSELLELVQLEQFADRMPAQLSGGQRQRMALARALAVEPTVLLLDEPFGALDAQVRKQLRAWLRRLHDEVQVTTVFVTHDQEEALEVSDEVVVINHGRVEQTGPPHELYDRPANPFVMQFLGPTTQLSGRWVRPHAIEILPSSAAGAVPARVHRLVRVGHEIRAELRAPDGEPWVQLARSHANALGLEPDRAVWLRAAPGAATLSAG